MRGGVSGVMIEGVGSIERSVDRSIRNKYPREEVVRFCFRTKGRFFRAAGRRDRRPTRDRSRPSAMAYRISRRTLAATGALAVMPVDILEDSLA